MDHVPLPQRPPRRKRPRPVGEADAGARFLDGASASDGEAAGRFRDVANVGAGDDVGDETREARDDRPDLVPEFVPGVPIFDGTSVTQGDEYKDHTADIQIHAWGRNVEACFAWAALGMFNYMTPLDNLRSSAEEAKTAHAHTVGGLTHGTDDPENGNSNRRVPGNRNMRKDDGAGDGAGDEKNEKRAHKIQHPKQTDTEILAEHLSVGYQFEVTAHDMHSLLFAFLDELLFRFHTSMVVCRRIQLQKIDRENWKVKGVALGERFVDGVHEQGTEIKAITYSAMQIVEKGRGGTETPGDGHDAELFVIVDI